MRTRLGRGLDALIPSGAESTDRTTGITTVLIDNIHPNPFQPRQNFNEEKLQELANSLTESGMIQPIIVTKKDKTGYELIAGERRLEAAKLAGFTEVPVIIRCVSPREQLQFALIENIQRENLNPMEEARAYEQLQSQFKLTHVDIAKFVGKERSTVTNSIRLLKLEPGIQEMIAEEKLTPGHARALLQLEGEDQIDYAAEIVRKQLSVRQTENGVRKRLSARNMTKSTPEPQDKEYLNKMRDSLSRQFALPVSINPRKRGGTISFSYRNAEEFQKLLDILINKK